MATDDDDDILTGLVPDPDAEPTAAERAHAKTFAELVDKAFAGRPPAAMSTDDRALLEVATVIRATSREVPLAPANQRALIEDALRQAVGVGAAGASGGAIAPIERARARRAPWLIAGASAAVAAAAIAVLWFRPPQAAAPAAAALPASWTSRPADPLIGPIPRERAGDASTRLDYIFADRLASFRERRMSSRGGKP